MSNSSKDAFSDFDIANRTIRNRFAVAPMTRVTATEDGLATDRMGEYYNRFAKGGFGLIITEGLYTDQTFSQGNSFQPGMSSPEQASSWKGLVGDLQKHGSTVFAQLMHAGALVQGNRFVSGALAPSAIQPRGKQMESYRGNGPFPVPSEITDEQLADAVAGFGKSAGFVIDAGFDGIEIHGANGYLLDQFLTDYTNTRTDKWGGDTSARVQLILEVVKEVKNAVAGRAPVGVRISQGKVNDFFHKWAGGEKDAEIVFGLLADAAVDFIHVTEFVAAKPAFDSSDKTLVQLARTHAPKTAVIANGSVHTLEDAGLLMEHGADLIAIGRSALANPDWPTRVSQGLDLREFDPSILGPIAFVKDSELGLA